MNADFSRTLALLRQEKEISQRKAAADLGISQALLSHYENGVREPGLAFVKKACDYYHVSADYLLGRTLDRDGGMIDSDELYDSSDEKGTLRGSIAATLQKKLLVNTVNLLFELLGKTNCREAVTAAGQYLGTAIYPLYRALHRAAGDRSVVIPGFYGVMPDGRIRTFSRGGSDITGALAAAALDADVYENWTDVSGILMADPRIVDDPAPIRHLTYGELRELSYIGAQVLHEGTIFPVREKNIPLNIRNTNEPEHPGTTILESIEEDTNDGSFITGIAGKKGFSVITIAKTGMSGDPGTLVRILEILAKHEVNVEYIPSGIDIISLVVESKKVSKCLYAMLGELQKEVQPNKITVTEHIAVVAAVGRKMAYRPGVSGKIFAKLGENGVNIRMITQGPEELNIIVGVEEKDFAQAIRVLYDSFVKEHI